MSLKVKTPQIALIFDVEATTVNRWRAKGLPTEKKKNAYYYDVLETALWHQKNIQSSPFKGGISLDDDISVEDQLRIKRMEKLDLEMAIQRGEYIEIDEVDEITAKLVALLINQYRQFMRTMPKVLSKKTETQIKKSLDTEFEKSIEQLNKAYENKGLEDE